MSRKEANIRKRKDGRWEARLVLGKKSDGTTLYKSIYGKTYNEAREKRKNEMISSCQPKQKRQSSHNTFYDISQQWLDCIEKEIKESSYSKYCYVCNKYLSEFHLLDISEINDKKIESYITQHIQDNDNEYQYTYSTMKLILSVLRMILEYAKKINIPVCCHIESINIKNTRTEAKYLSFDEQIIIENAIKYNDELYTLAIWLGLYTGMRIGEICALQWKDIDLNSRMIYVSKTIQRIHNTNPSCQSKTKIVVGQPKSKKSIRSIPIPDCCFKKIKQYYSIHSDDYILTGNKHFMEPRLLEYHFNKFIKKCNLKDIHFHTLRHTFTTRCIEFGFEIKTLSEILGHSSVSFTLDRYGHSSVQTKVNNMNKIQLLTQ